MAKFAVGDTVQVYTKWGVARGTATVEKVLKTRLVLSNGERYDLEGYYANGNSRGSRRNITKVS